MWLGAGPQMRLVFTDYVALWVYSKQQGGRFAEREVFEAGALWPQHRTILFSCAALCLGTKVKSASERQFI
jgi:hypothetical protein